MGCLPTQRLMIGGGVHDLEELDDVMQLPIREGVFRLEVARHRLSAFCCLRPRSPKGVRKLGPAHLCLNSKRGHVASATVFYCNIFCQYFMPLYNIKLRTNHPSTHTHIHTNAQNAIRFANKSATKSAYIE